MIRWSLMLLSFYLVPGGLLFSGAGEVFARTTGWPSVYLAKGDSLLAAGQYQSARYYLKEAAAYWAEKQQGDQAVYSRYRVALNELRSGELTQAETQARRALQLSYRYLTPEHPTYAQAHSLLGTILAYSSQPDSALHYSRQSLRLRRQHHPSNQVALADSYNALGASYRYGHQSDSALHYYRLALRCLQRVSSPDVHTLVQAHLNVGIVHSETQYPHYDSAIYFCRQAGALALKQWPERHAIEGNVYNNLAKAYLRKGYYHEAQLAYQQALDVQILFSGDNHLNTVRYHRRLGDIYLATGAYAMAEQHFREGLICLKKSEAEDLIMAATLSAQLASVADIASDSTAALDHLYRSSLLLQEQRGDNSTAIADVYRQIGEQYTHRGKYSIALRYLRQGQSIQQDLLGEDHVSLIPYYIALGELQEKQAQYSLALSSYRRVLTISQSVSGAVSPEAATVWNKMGAIYRRMGQAQRALQCFRRSVRANLIALPSAEPNALASYLHPQELLQARQAQAHTLLTFSDDPERWQEALTICLASDTIIDQLRRTYLLHDDQVRLNAQVQRIHVAGLEASHRLYQTTGRPQYIAHAFYFSEKSKASMLINTLSDLSAKGQVRLPDSLLTQERALSIERAYYTSLLTEERQNAPSDESLLDTYQSRLFDIKQQQQQLTALLEKRFPEYYRTKYRSQVTTLPRLQRSLTEHDLLLTYAMSDSVLYQLSVTRDTAWLTRQTYDSTLHQDIRELRNTLTTEVVAAPSQSNYRSYTCHAFRLYQRLLQRPLAQVSSSSTPIRRLIVVPDGELAYVPYDLLLTHSPNHRTFDFRQLPYVLKKYHVSYGYSATWLYPTYTPPPIPPTNGQLIAFAPQGKSVSKPIDYSSESSSIALRNSQAEVTQISQYFPTRLYTGSTARKQTFQREAPAYDLVHLATHGYVDKEDPMASYLLFGEGGDDVLYAHELYGMNFPAKLVVLSACQTGDGILTQGEGIQSLAQGFAYAGSQSIVMSHWSADDEVTATLMTHFYRLLAEGVPKDEALARAKRQFLDETSAHTAHPYYWGNFALFGERSAVVLPTRSQLGYWWWVAGIVGLIGMYRVGRKHFTSGSTDSKGIH